MNDHVKVLREKATVTGVIVEPAPPCTTGRTRPASAQQQGEIVVTKGKDEHAIAACEREAHPSITHCDNCGLDWLDNGLNPIGCPYCKHAALVVERDLLDQQLADAMATVARMDNEAAALAARLGELVERWRNDAKGTVGTSDLARVVKEINGG